MYLVTTLTKNFVISSQLMLAFMLNKEIFVNYKEFKSFFL